MAQSLEDGRARERHLLLAVSHDLRTPLTSIRGFAEAIQDGAIEDSGQAADVIIAESRRLERLVGDLLDLTKLEARQMSISLRPTDAAEVVADDRRGVPPRRGQERAGHRAAVPGPRTVLPVAGRPAFPVVADPDRLAQLLANLLENAITFARTAVTVGLAEDGASGVCVITVDDDGPGIAHGRSRRACSSASTGPTAGPTGGWARGSGWPSWPSWRRPWVAPCAPSSRRRRRRVPLRRDAAALARRPAPNRRRPRIAAPRVCAGHEALFRPARRVRCETMDVQEAIQNAPLFAHLTKKDIKQLAAVLTARSFPAGTVVIEQGKPGVGFFIIASGSAAVTVGGQPDRTARRRRSLRRDRVDRRRPPGGRGHRRDRPRVLRDGRLAVPPLRPGPPRCGVGPPALTRASGSCATPRPARKRDPLRLRRADHGLVPVPVRVRVRRGRAGQGIWCAEASGSFPYFPPGQGRRTPLPAMVWETRMRAW